MRKYFTTLCLFTIGASSVFAQDNATSNHKDSNTTLIPKLFQRMKDLHNSFDGSSEYIVNYTPLAADNVTTPSAPPPPMATNPASPSGIVVPSAPPPPLPASPTTTGSSIPNVDTTKSQVNSTITATPIPIPAKTNNDSTNKKSAGLVEILLNQAAPDNKLQSLTNTPNISLTTSNTNSQLQQPNSSSNNISTNNAKSQVQSNNSSDKEIPNTYNFYLKDILEENNDTPSDKKNINKNDSNISPVELEEEISQPSDKAKDSNSSDNDNKKTSKIAKEKAEKPNPIPEKRPDNSYRNTKLPPLINRKEYSVPNSHLPKAYYVEDYKKILFNSAAQGKVNVVKALVNYFDDVDVRDANNNTPLLYASMAGNIDSVTSLLYMGANPNVTNNQGITPLYAATQLSRSDLIKILLDHGASPSKISNTTNSLNDAITLSNDRNVIRQFIQKMPNINDVDNNGNTALHSAVKNNNIVATEILLEQAANPNLINNSGHSPLMIAAYSGNAKIVQLLLAAKADPDKQNKNGYNSAQIAFARNFKEIAQIIRDKSTEYSIYGKPNFDYDTKPTIDISQVKIEEPEKLQPSKQPHPKKKVQARKKPLTKESAKQKKKENIIPLKQELKSTNDKKPATSSKQDNTTKTQEIKPITPTITKTNPSVPNTSNASSTAQKNDKNTSLPAKLESNNIEKTSNLDSLNKDNIPDTNKTVQTTTPTANTDQQNLPKQEDKIVKQQTIDNSNVKPSIANIKNIESEQKGSVPTPPIAVPANNNNDANIKPTNQTNPSNASTPSIPEPAKIIQAPTTKPDSSSTVSDMLINPKDNNQATSSPPYDTNNPDKAKLLNNLNIMIKQNSSK